MPGGRTGITHGFLVVSNPCTMGLCLLHEAAPGPVRVNRCAGSGDPDRRCYHPSSKPPLVLEPQERSALLLLGAVLAILTGAHLVLSALGDVPFASPYGEGSREGDLVVLTGVVGAVTPTSTGGHLLVSVNGTRVFIPSPASREVVLHLNDTVRIYGIVQVYQGTKEVAVRSAGDVRQVEPGP
jgi:hypothetical protein